MSSNNETTDANSRASREASLASISRNIDNLELFLDQLTHTLIAQNHDIEALNRQHQLVRNQSGTNRSPSPYEVTSNIPIPHSALCCSCHGNPHGSCPCRCHNHGLRPSRLTMLRECTHRNNEESRRNHAASATTELEQDFSRHMDNINRHEYQPGAELDYQIEFQSSYPSRRMNPSSYPYPVSSENETGTNTGYSTPITVQSTTMLLDVIKRAAEAAATAGDVRGRTQLEEFHRELSSFASPGPVMMQNLGSTQLNLAQQNNPISLSTASNPSNRTLLVGSDSESESETTGSEFDMGAWDRGTTFLRGHNFTHIMTDSDSSSSDEDGLVFLGARNFQELYNAATENATANVATEQQRMNRVLNSENRRMPNRNVSPATLEFYQNIGIRIDDKDAEGFKNGFKDSFVMSCPKTLYPPEDLLGEDTPEPLYNTQSDAEINKDAESNDLVYNLDLSHTQETDDCESTEKGNAILPGTQDLRDVSGLASLGCPCPPPPIELDDEDLELEKLIQDFRRKKLEEKNACETFNTEVTVGNISTNKIPPTAPTSPWTKVNTEKSKTDKCGGGDEIPKSAPVDKEESKVRRFKMTATGTTATMKKIKKKSPQ